MPITDPLLLSHDVVFTALPQMDTGTGSNAARDAHEYAITRLGSRIPSSVIDQQAVELLNQFREPKTIPEAVMNYSRTNRLDPQTVLEEAFPMLGQLWASRILVASESEEARRIAPSAGSGARLAGVEVLTCLQVLEDTEVYEVKTQASRTAVLKVLRGEGNVVRHRMLAREAAILRHLDGVVSPRLIEFGTAEGRPFLLMELCPGIPVHIAAQKLRQQTGAKGRQQLARLSCNILDCYSRLHDREVLHADVHHRNLLVAEDESLRIVDFGIAHWQSASLDWGEPERGGVAFFYEPEYASAVRSRQELPPVTYLAEQYSLAALVSHLLTGAHYVKFSIEKDEMLRQIVEEQPEAFSRRGASPWPRVEKVLAKALSKSPGDRWTSVAEFSREFQEAARHPPTKTIRRQARNVLLGTVLDRVQASQPLFREGVKPAPFSSVNMGGAGIAYALYRIACIRSDAALLALADLWSTRAAAASSCPDAFYSRHLDLTPETVGRISPYHTSSGVHLVHALISRARGDFACLRKAVAGFSAASALPCENLDLTLGRSAPFWHLLYCLSPWGARIHPSRSTLNASETRQCARS